jgi:hypothetical protein
MEDKLTKVFKERVLKSAKEHIGEKDTISELNDVFSLKMGMNIKEIETILSNKLINLDSEFYVCELLTEVEGINKLYFWVSEKEGLYSLFALNEEIECDGFALNLKKQLFAYEKIFEVGYGKYIHKETELSDLSNSYNTWLDEVEKGNIKVETVFNKEAGSNLKNDIKQILIGISKESGEKPSIIIVFKFNNAKE